MKKLLLLVVVLFFSSGCAAIINGATQEVRINSVPSKAEGFIEGIKIQTPATVVLKRNHDHEFVLTKEGFKETSAKIQSICRWEWLLLDIPLAFPFGLLIDLDGGAYYYLPKEVVISLEPIPSGGKETREH